MRPCICFNENYHLYRIPASLQPNRRTGSGAIFRPPGDMETWKFAAFVNFWNAIAQKLRHFTTKCSQPRTLQSVQIYSYHKMILQPSRFCCFFKIFLEVHAWEAGLNNDFTRSSSRFANFGSAKYRWRQWQFNNAIGKRSDDGGWRLIGVSLEKMFCFVSQQLVIDGVFNYF